MGENVFVKRVAVDKVAVTAGSTSNPIYLDAQMNVITCIPGAGGTMVAYATWSTRDDIIAGTANWFTWDNGTVSSSANQLLYCATAVKFTATTAAGTGEVAR